LTIAWVLCYENTVRVTWREALKEVCRAAGFSQAALADKADLWPMALTRYLRKANTDGAYAPDAKRVRDLNHAAAELAGVPEIEPYLNALGIFDGLLAPQGGGEADFAFLAELVAEFDPYFQRGALRAMVDAMASLDQSARLDIARSCAVARGRELVRWLARKPPKSAGLAEFLAFFRDAGAPLDGALRWNEAVVRRFLRDRFDARVCQAIAGIDGGTPAAPLVAARVILNAFDGALDDALDPKLTAAIVRHRLVPRSSSRAVSLHTLVAGTVGKEQNRP
jgi:transcriptional regulator with XRE-family HTH domain